MNLKKMKFEKISSLFGKFFIFSLFILVTANYVFALSIAIPNKINTLDPRFARIAQDRFILPLIFDYLFIVDPMGAIKNNLISKWKYDEKGKVIYFELKKDFHFSDGSSLSAVDVYNTFIEVCKPELPSSSQFFGFKGCGSNSFTENIHIINNYEISLNITVHPNSLFYQLTYGAASIFKKLTNGTLIGSGPYKIEELKNGNGILTSNSYFNPKSKFNKLEFKFISEDTIQEELKSQKIDLASMYVKSTFFGFHSENYQIYSNTPNVTQILVLNPNVEPFIDINLRRNIYSELINSKDLFDCKKNTIKAKGFIPLGVGGSLNPRFELRINSTKLKPNKIKNVNLYRHIGRKNLCEEENIKAIGNKFHINFIFNYLENYDHLLKLYSDKNTQAYMELTPFISRDPSSVLRRLIPLSHENPYFYSSKGIESKLRIAWEKQTINERFKIYKEINEHLIEDSIILPLYYIGSTFVISKCFRKFSTDLNNYNPNSFLFLLDLEKSNECNESFMSI